jgi:L-amino acid N-acyltransferase YncA
MIRVRPYQPADLQALVAIMNQIVERGDAFVYDAPFTAAQMRQYIESHSAAYVAVRNDRLVGGYVLRPNQPGRGAHVANATYMVAPDVQGRGIGGLLGEHSLKEARRLGYLAMQFNAVVAGNEPALSLWQRLGFTIIGRIPAAFRRGDGPLEDLCIMHRAL